MNLDLGAKQPIAAAYRAKSPLSMVPTLELEHGRLPSESRTVCTDLEGLFPQPSLRGASFDERACVDRAKRQAQLYFFGAVANCIRHIHPGPAPLEGRQIADYGSLQGDIVRAPPRWTRACSHYGGGMRSVNRP